MVHTEYKNHNPILHLYWIISPFFHKRWFSLSCLGVQVVLDYKFCYRQYAFREHSSLPAIFLVHIVLLVTTLYIQTLSSS